MPFVIRYGITIVVIAIIAVGIMLYISGGSTRQLMKEIIVNTLEQIKIKAV